MEKIPVYFVPGLGASPLIFEWIRLPEDTFQTIWLEWEIPLEKENLVQYAKRLSEKITHLNPVLIGVSFGGLVVQEMAQFVNPRKVVIISSAKSNNEYPKLFKFGKTTGAYKLMPVTLLVNIDRLANYRWFGAKINQRLRLYKKYIGPRDKRYWNWAIQQVIMWDRTVADEKVIHIHGTDDEIFPARYIKNYIPIEGGTHIMLILKVKWLNEHLPAIILGEVSK